MEHIEAVEHTEKMLSRSMSASCIFFAIILICSVSGGSCIRDFQFFKANCYLVAEMLFVL